jgi:hypothetical protein
MSHKQFPFHLANNLDPINLFGDINSPFVLNFYLLSFKYLRKHAWS